MVAVPVRPPGHPPPPGVRLLPQPSPIGERVSQVGTLFYFGFFLLMPWWSRLGAFKPVPDRITFAH